MCRFARIFITMVGITVLAYWVLSWSYDAQTRLVPLIMGSVTLLLAAMVIFREFCLPAVDANEEEGGGGDGNLRNLLFIAIWMVAFWIMVLLVGFLISIPVAMLIFMRYYKPLPWHRRLLATGITWLAIYGMFEVLMGFTLFRGVLGGGILM